MKDARQRSGAARFSKRLLPFFLMTGLTLFFLFGGHEIFSFNQLAENYTSLKAFVGKRLVTAWLVFGTVYILTAALSLPVASLLTLAGGALFGWTAAPLIICAATIGATIVFIAARTVLNEFFVKRTAGFWQNWKPGFIRMPFLSSGPAPDLSSFLGCEYRPRPVGDATEPLCDGNVHWHNPRHIDLCLGCQKL